MGGIAICFPMSELQVTGALKLKTVSQYIGHINRCYTVYGRTKENHEGIARRADDRRGRTKYDTPYLAKLSATKTGQSKETHPHIAVIMSKRTGRTKETHEYLARASAKMTGRTAETHEGVARSAEKHRGRTKETHPYLLGVSEYRKTHVGEYSSNWKGGVSFIKYPKEFGSKLKEYIRKRDNYCCQGCGIEEKRYYRKLDIHHINYNKRDIVDSNLISACHTCNSKANANSEFWQRFYTDKLLIKTSDVIIYG
jgi:hypothetical protein